MSSFLRSQLARLRGQFSTAALILSVVALVAALGGGAIAASRSARDSKTKVVKGPPGKPGKDGLQGAEGKQGPAGTPGAPGAPGAAGKNLVIGSAPSCEEGGTSFEVEGSPSTRRVVCNGIEGPPGQRGDEGEEGEPGENGQTGFTETLPSGQTETGAWISPAMFEEVREQVAISFPIPLPSPLGFEEQHYVTIEEQENHSSSTCPGTARRRSGTRQPLHLRGRGGSGNRRSRSRALGRGRQAPRLPGPRSRHRGRRYLHPLRRPPFHRSGPPIRQLGGDRALGATTFPPGWIGGIAGRSGKNRQQADGTSSKAQAGRRDHTRVRSLRPHWFSPPARLLPTSRTSTTRPLPAPSATTPGRSAWRSISPTKTSMWLS